MKTKQKYNNKMKILPLIIITLVIFSGIFIALNAKADDDCNFCVQIGAFKKESNAIALKNKASVEITDYPVFIDHIRGWYHVRVGRDLTNPQANTLSSLLRKDYSGAWIPANCCLVIGEEKDEDKYLMDIKGTGTIYVGDTLTYTIISEPGKELKLLGKSPNIEVVEDFPAKINSEGKAFFKIKAIGPKGDAWVRIEVKGITRESGLISMTEKKDIIVKPEEEKPEEEGEEKCTIITAIASENLDTITITVSGTALQSGVVGCGLDSAEVDKKKVSIATAGPFQKTIILETEGKLKEEGRYNALCVIDEGEGEVSCRAEVKMPVEIEPKTEEEKEVQDIKKKCKDMRTEIDQYKDKDDKEKKTKFDELNKKLDEYLKRLKELKKKKIRGVTRAKAACINTQDAKEVAEKGDGDKQEPTGGWSSFLWALQKAKVLECFETEKVGDKITVKPVWREKGFKSWKAALCLYEATLLGISAVEAIPLAARAGTCFAEQPLKRTDYCESCNKPFMLCTEDRCNILGTCKFVPKTDATGGICMPGVCTPTEIPLVETMDIRFFIDRTKSWKNITNIRRPCKDPSVPSQLRDSANCFEQKGEIPHTVSDIEINISLNQHAKCRYILDKYNASFEEMTGEFEDNQYYPTSQFARIDVTGLELGEKHTIYIKCEGACGQAHDPGFDWNFIRFEFEEKPDELPPVIVKFVPDPLTQYISNESTEETIEIWLDEAGFCKYSHVGEMGKCSNLTTDWNKMCGANEVEHNVKSFSCNRNKAQCCSPGTPEPVCYDKYECGRCNLTIDPREGYDELNWTKVQEGLEIPDIAKKLPKDALDYMKNLGMTGIGKVFTYMFRCSDYPAGNKMREENSYMYVIMTYPPFEMNLTEPENGSESYEREWNISVETSRPTECRYAVNNKSFAWPVWEDMEAVDDGFRIEHEGMTEELAPADYYMHVLCRDTGGLEEKDLVTFTVLKDTTEPIAIRLYGWQDYLYIETNEKSDCVYSVVDCDYNFSDGAEMVGNMQYVHSAPWSLDHNYYVKCMDRWDNEPSAKECTIIVSPYEIPEL